jgi:hypothetical protein
MPTQVQFISGHSITLAEDFREVNQQLGEHPVAMFTRPGPNRVQVTVFASAVAYLQPMSEDEVKGGGPY